MNIFYLDWTNKRPISNFIGHIPDNIDFTTSIKIRGHEHTINDTIVCGSIRPDYNYKASCIHYTKKSFLQSHLQKNIRKMNLNSVKTAKHIIDLDPNILLRRLPIIMFEDVIPHDSINTIIWLMIAVSKGYKLKNYMVEWLLGVVYWLTICKKHDIYDNTYPKIFTDINRTSYKDKTFLKSCVIRLSYGGMKCDMCMIKYFIDYYNNENILLNQDKVKFIKLDIARLEHNEWDITANDFHCDHKLLININKQYPMFDIDYIRHLIWTYSSRKNLRIIENDRIDEEYKDWKIIKKFTRYLQKNMNYY
jgi:hypothetical protein